MPLRMYIFHPNTTRLSHPPATRISCVITITVLVSVNRRNNPTTTFTISGSNDAVGSSNKRMLLVVVEGDDFRGDSRDDSRGNAATAPTSMHVRTNIITCFCPPDTALAPTPTDRCRYVVSLGWRFNTDSTPKACKTRRMSRARRWVWV